MKTWNHMIWTSIVGLSAIVFLFYELKESNALDGLTAGIVGLVSALWFVLQFVSFVWQKRLSTEVPEVHESLLIYKESNNYLSIGISGEIASDAVSSRSSPVWLGLGSTTLISLGLAGTFLGLTLGLFGALPLMAEDQVTQAIEKLLDGAKLAFVKSLAGIGLAMLWNFRLMEIRSTESQLQRSLMKKLDEMYPPVTSERMLAWAGLAQESQAARQEQSMQGLTQEILALRAAVQNQEQAVVSALAGVRGEQGDTLTTLRGDLRTAVQGHEAAVVGALHGVRGAANESSETVRKEVESLSQVLQASMRLALNDLRGELGVTLTTLRGDLRTAVQGHETAVVGALHGVRGEQDDTLGTVRAEVENLKITLQDLAEILPDKIGVSAGSNVGSVLQPKLEDLASILQALGSTGKEAIGEAMKENMGDEVSGLRDALVAVSAALVSLPDQIAAGGTAAAETLTQASNTGAQQLSSAAGEVAEQTRVASESLQDLHRVLAAAGEIVSALREGGESLRESFAGVAEPLLGLPASLRDAQVGVESAGRVMREDVVGELREIHGTLKDQHAAQSGALDTWREAHQTATIAADGARQQLEGLTRVGESFAKKVDEIRGACDATVDNLGKITGSQQAGADEAVKRLLEAVDAFSKALQENQDTIRDAGMASVASTEQVTAEAARKVADALASGAEKLTGSIQRAHELGEAISRQSAVLKESLMSAETHAGALRVHGEAMVNSGQKLKSEVAGLAAPLSGVRSGLEQVGPAVRDAAAAMKIEQNALVGLHKSLKEQAELIQQQEKGLTERTTELRRLHEVLGSGWAGHIERMSDAHGKVRDAWQQAMNAATTGLDKNASQIATYAERVEKALGLKDEVSGLQTNLGELADSLGELTPVLKTLGGEVKQLKNTVDRL